LIECFSPFQGAVDEDFNNPSFLKAVIKIQAAYRGHKCRQQLDDQDMAMMGY
jgi:IQ calmodulin-binding motif